MLHGPLILPKFKSCRTSYLKNYMPKNDKNVGKVRAVQVVATTERILDSRLLMYIVQQNIFWKTFIKVFSLHHYASFGTFCVQIGQLFAAQWVFKHSEEFRNRRHFPSRTANCQFSNILQRLTVPRIIDQFWRKRCQMKRKDVDYKLLNEFFQRYFVVYEQSAVENSSTN